MLFACLAACLILVNACDKSDKTQPVKITGEWNLTGAELTVKSTQIGTETVDVYIAFNADGTFDMYQMTGRGRYDYYGGKWKLSGTVLEGTYNDPKKPNGKPWGNVYEVQVNGDELVMTATRNSSDRYTYTRCVIPEKVKTEAVR